MQVLEARSRRRRFFCRIEVDWPEGTKIRKIYGVDEVQALCLALQTAHTDLLVARERGGRQVSWLGQRRLGLPVADADRDWDSDGDIAAPPRDG